MTGYVAVIDYGMGNLHSVASALEHAGASRVAVTHDPDVIAGADRVVFPGVGAIRDCMAAILDLGVDRIIASILAQGDKPLLAICVGMQALFDRSDENGGVAALGAMPGEVKHFGEGLTDSAGRRLKVPHMGWNTVAQTRTHPLWSGIPDGTRFYFVHSYWVQPAAPEVVAGAFSYGVSGCAAAARDNLFAVQFHPEKSHTPGLQLLANFMQWDGTC